MASLKLSSIAPSPAAKCPQAAPLAAPRRIAPCLPSHHCCNIAPPLLQASTSRSLSVRASIFPFANKKKDKQALKEELLQAIAPLDRGADASPDDQSRVEQIAKSLEAASPVKDTLKSPLINGKWELLYTTSATILKIQRPKFLRPRGPIYQAINTDTLRAQNLETWPYFNQVTANLTPLNSRKVAVKFDVFKIAGLISIKAPDRARGELEITFLDEELRKCNLAGRICSPIAVFVILGGKCLMAYLLLDMGKEL